MSYNNNDFKVCYYCKNRSINCHGTCIKSLEEVVNHEKEKERIKKEKRIEHICNERRSHYKTY